MKINFFLVIALMAFSTIMIVCSTSEKAPEKEDDSNIWVYIKVVWKGEITEKIIWYGAAGHGLKQAVVEGKTREGIHFETYVLIPSGTSVNEEFRGGFKGKTIYFFEVLVKTGKEAMTGVPSRLGHWTSKYIAEKQIQSGGWKLMNPDIHPEK